VLTIQGFCIKIKPMLEKTSRRTFLKGITSMLVLAMAEHSFPQILKIIAPTIEKTEEWLEIKNSVEKLKKFGLKENELAIVINPQRQKLYLVKNSDIIKDYLISTGKNGIGNKKNTGKTPFGTHKIKEKIGDNSPSGTIFKHKKNTHQIAEIHTDKFDGPNDYVTSRILSLTGLEKNINCCNPQNDTFSRSIYIHGTNEEGLLGAPASHGCIRMKNSDVIEIYDLVNEGTLIEIQNKQYR
jgi:hypothetical protein